MAVLHVTNGTAAAQDLKTLGEEVLTWDDVLHEGPVLPEPPERLRETRARFLAAAGLTDLTEARARLAARDARLDAVDFSTKLVLWFEDDLYDQLQLVQILDRLATGEGALRRSRPLGPVQLVRLPRGRRTFLRDRLARAVSLREADHATARAAWAALTAPDPRAVQDVALRLAERPPANLPDLAAALHRLLEEHPANRRPQPHRTPDPRGAPEWAAAPASAVRRRRRARGAPVLRRRDALVARRSPRAGPPEPRRRRRLRAHRRRPRRPCRRGRCRRAAGAAGPLGRRRPPPDHARRALRPRDTPSGGLDR